MELILASASPRREELLRQLGLSFNVVPSFVTEGEPYRPWQRWVLELARAKALALPAGNDEIVLAADTIVIAEERVFGKPADAEEAREMLTALAGRAHEVMTGVCALRRKLGALPELQVFEAVETTKVWFRRLTESEIRAYAESGEPLDKAGAYGIQGLGALLVERIEGDYYNVMGLPLVTTSRLLEQCGLKILGGS